MDNNGAPQASQHDPKKTIRIGESSAIGPGEKCFIIAEIGQNHQGDLTVAKEMIRVAKECGVDCVKFQKSHLPSKFNRLALDRPYVGPNSWGPTYGAHKRFLEFSDGEFRELQKFSQDQGILFSSSVMDDVSLKFVNSLNVPFIKIGSGDTHNRKLLSQAADLGKPLIVSTGMSNIEQVTDLYDFLKSKQVDFCLLHCVSSYPVPIDEVNLNVIKTYQTLFPDVNIGYSGHELGIDIALAAVALGAKIIERHFTLDKSLKGTDHVCSLTPPEFKEMVQRIRQFENKEISVRHVMGVEVVQRALGDGVKKFETCEKPCYDKLGKTLVAFRKLNRGDILTLENVRVKVAEPKGVPGSKINDVIGKTVNRVVEEDESITEDVLN